MAADNPCKLTECQGKPRCRHCAAMDRVYLARSGWSDKPIDPAALIQRIDAAIRRITSGNAAMRVPAEDTGPDLVLADCKKLLLAYGVQEVPRG
jgi:DNA-binding response OmpR family regulator